MKRAILLLSSSLFAAAASAQQKVEATIDLEGLTEDLLSFQDEDLNYAELYDNLVQILSSPFDLNSVTREELQQLHILSDAQIESFLTYRGDQKTLIDIHELQIIDEFTPEVIQRLLPFVFVRDPATQMNRAMLRRMTAADNTYLVTRYERSLEKGASAFQGSADKMFLRLRSSTPGDYSFGFTGEKDPGEKIIFNPTTNQWSLDFWSYHFQLRNKGKLKNLILGDFQAQFAQGLLLGGAFGLGKGGETISAIRKSHIGFQPYTSINENAFQRGIAFTFPANREIDVSIFHSSVLRDAALNDTDDISSRSLQATGYHRTPMELRNRKSLREQNTGIVVQWLRKKLETGLIANYIRFGSAVSRPPNLYNQYTFRGADNINGGVFFNYRLRNISFFSEAAHSFPGGTGVLAGVLMSVHKNLEIAMLYRSYTADFYSFYSNAFSENTQPQNEHGMYWGWKYRWNRRYSINGYLDLFTFPWLAFRRYAPSDGYEWLLRGNYQPSRAVSLVLQIREETKDANNSETTNLYKVGQRLRRNIALHLNFSAGNNLLLKTRIQYSAQHFESRVTEGWALMQDVSFTRGKFQFTMRHGLFDTDHYDNRQYVYERDTWSSYSLPAYAGTGVRNYALIEHKVSKRLTVWIRFARTRLITGGEISVPEDVIDGNTRNDIKFQVRLKF